MHDKITTLKLIDNTEVFPNIKDENIPNTIMRIADLSKYLNQLKSINITGDIDSTTITSDIATFTTADISTLNVSGVSHFEGEATFGHNVHVDGNIVVNGIDNIVDKYGNKIVNTGTFDSTSDNPAGQKSTAEALVSKDEYYANYAIYRFAETTFNWWNAFDVMINRFLNATRIDGMFSNARVIWKNFELTIPSFKNRVNSCIHAFSFAEDSNVISLTIQSNNFDGGKIFGWALSLESIKIADGADVKLSGNCHECFYTCANLVEIGAFDLSEATTLVNAFDYDAKLKHIHLKNIPVSFDISASTQFDEADLVEIIGNLVNLTGKPSQTLTMGATNLAKLTDAEKAVAINKNWVLA